MNSLDTIQKLSKIGKILSKIAFIFSAIGVCGCIVSLLSLSFGSVSLIKIGGITLHGMISRKYSCNIKSVFATLCGWLIICVGEAILAKFAESYFRNELKAGTPFTFSGAKELLRLGILTLTVPTGCAVIGSIADFMSGEKAVATDMHFDDGTSIVLGIMFILGSLLCRYGAGLKGNT